MLFLDMDNPFIVVFKYVLLRKDPVSSNRKHLKIMDMCNDA